MGERRKRHDDMHFPLQGKGKRATLPASKRDYVQFVTQPTHAADLRRLFEILDTTEETDTHRMFHPVTINCCRVMLHVELTAILDRLRAYAAEGGEP